MKSNLITLLIFLSFVPVLSRPRHKSVLSDSGDFCLWYDNLYSRDSVLLSFLHDSRSQKPCVPSIPTSYENLAQIEPKTRVSESVFRRILSYDAVIHSSSESKKQTKTASIIKEKACYYCGRVKISKRFDSYLFHLQHLNSDPKEKNGEDEDDDEMLIDDKMILVNLFDDKITSISCMLSYFCCDDYLSYSQIDSYRRHNDYLFCSGSEHGDVVYPNDSNTDYRKVKIRFKFNDIGQIVILPLKH
ncbi:MAG: hypothetical protein E7070_05875 [Bacteroidales bacterium]|nr:hypothetical protein [Bacteroidales bacterium]